MIVMTGGGDSQNYRELDSTFQRSLPKNARLLLIPIANDPDEYDDVYDRISDTFSSKNIEAIDMKTDLTKLSRSEMLSYSAVYLDGGNTFALLEQIRQSSFTEDIKEFYQQGGFVYGDSAGAIIIGSHIGTAHLGEETDENIAHLQSFHGLALLDSWSIHCHYESSDDEFAQDFVYNTGSPLLAISEETGIMISSDGDLTVFGRRPLAAFTFTGKQHIERNTQTRLSDFLE